MKAYTYKSCEGVSTTIEIVQGETLKMQSTISLDGTAINLTGASVKMTINFPDPVILTTENGGVTVISAANGIVRFNIPSSDSIDYPVGEVPYDTWLVSGGGEATPLNWGGFKVTAKVSATP